MKRILLFLATNIAVLVLLSIVLRLLGVDSILDEQGVGIDTNALLVFSAVLGFGGSLISLAMSKWIAKRSTGARVIEQPANDVEAWLVSRVKQHAQQAGIDTPEVAIYDAPEPNAFATGARRNAALVAVSTGLMRNMRREEVDAVVVGVVPLTAALKTVDAELADPESLAVRIPAIFAATDKPMVAVVDSGPRFDPLIRALRLGGVPVFPSADQAIRSLGRYLCYRTES